MDHKSKLHNKPSILESDYIAQLNKAKEENIDALEKEKNKQKFIMKRMTTVIEGRENIFDRKKRWQMYLDNLIESKHEDMKRKLLDLVDSIHLEEQEELESDLH